MFKTVKNNFFTVMLSALLLLLTSIVASPSIMAYATGDSVNVTIGNTSGTAGSDIEVPISFSNYTSNLGINNCDFIVSYDITKLTFKGVDPGSIILDPANDFSVNNVIDSLNPNISNIHFLFNDESGLNETHRPITADGTFATINFTICANVTTGSSISVNLSSYGAFSLPDTNLTTISAITTNGIVTVNASVDKSALNTAITNAETLIGRTTTGSAIGNVPQSAKDTYQSVIDAAKTVKDNLNATQADVDAQVTALATATTAFNAAVITVLPVDKTALNTAITNATALIGSITVGTAVGNVPQSAKTAFQAAIDAAVAVGNDANSTQAQVDAQVSALATATTAFNAAIIVNTSTIKCGDVNGDGKITSADALQILYYLANANNPKLSAKAKVNVLNLNIVDVNGDGKITSADALQILYYLANSNNPKLSSKTKTRIGKNL